MKIRTDIRRTRPVASFGVLLSSTLLTTAALAQGAADTPASTRNSTGGQGNTAQCSSMSGPARHNCEARMRADSQSTGVHSNSTTGADTSIPGATPTKPGSQTLQKDAGRTPTHSTTSAEPGHSPANSRISTRDTSAAADGERTRVSQRDQNAAPATPSDTRRNPLNSTDAAPTKTGTELGMNNDDADADANSSSNRGTTNSRPRPSDDAQSTSSSSTSQSTSDSAEQDRARSRPNENSGTTNSPR